MSGLNTSGDGVAATLESLQPRARSARSRALFLKRESNLRIFALQGLEDGWGAVQKKVGKSEGLARVLYCTIQRLRSLERETAEPAFPFVRGKNRCPPERQASPHIGNI